MEFFLQLLAEMAATAFSKEGVFGMQFHAELMCVGGLAVAADAHVAGGDTFDAAVFVEQHFSGGKAGENLHAQCFGLLAHPAHDVTEADNIVPVVLEALG